MIVCEHALGRRDKDGRVSYRCLLYNCYIGLDLDLFCFGCLDYEACIEDSSRGLKNASTV
ncbi:MAG TPA: hypothetical protein GX522_04480 [Firmicutes bacterium]|jgi:hypothetical protein|nr:hypothetical protein [Bacillota bacterium]